LFCVQSTTYTCVLHNSFLFNHQPFSWVGHTRNFAFCIAFLNIG